MYPVGIVVIVKLYVPNSRGLNRTIPLSVPSLSFVLPSMISNSEIVASNGIILYVAPVTRSLNSSFASIIIPPAKPIWPLRPRSSVNLTAETLALVASSLSPRFSVSLRNNY